MQRALDIEQHLSREIDEVVPAHAGLGSGTQIALAVAAGVRAVPRIASRCARRCRPARARRTLGSRHRTVRSWRSRRRWRTRTARRRPRRSSVECRSRSNGASWSCWIRTDRGCTAPDEREVFSKLAPSSDAEAAHLCRLVLMKALPALAECDIAGFGSAIKEMQMLLGRLFRRNSGRKPLFQPRCGGGPGCTRR